MIWKNFFRDLRRTASRLISVSIITMIAVVVYTGLSGIIYNVDLVLLAVFSLVLVGFAFIGRRHEMSRANGVVFVVLYAAYIATSLLR